MQEAECLVRLRSCIHVWFVPGLKQCVRVQSLLHHCEWSFPLRSSHGRILSSYCELYLHSITKVKHILENSFVRETEVLAVYVVACKLSLEDILPHRQSEQVGEGIIGNDFVLFSCCSVLALYGGMLC